jgi:hypothetical protein
MTSLTLRRTLLAAALLPALLTTAHAQQSGLVNVDISNVANNIAQNINVDVSQIPVTVQAPIGIAANVCGVNANVLARQGTGAAQCTATSTSTALNQLVQRQIKQNKNR